MEKLETYYEELDLLKDRLTNKHSFNENRKINMRMQDLQTRIKQELPAEQQIKRYKIDIQ